MVWHYAIEIQHFNIMAIVEEAAKSAPQMIDESISSKPYIY